MLTPAVIERELGANRNTLKVRLRELVEAGEMASAYLLPDTLAELAERAPLLALDLAPSNEVRDLIRREADGLVARLRFWQRT